MSMTNNVFANTTGQKERDKMTDVEREYFSELYDRHSKSVYGVCLMYLKNRTDSEDAVSEVFVRIMERKPVFESDAHAGAYLTRTAVNICKNHLKSPWRKSVVHDEEVLAYMSTPEDEGIMREVLALPARYRMVLYMHYYQRDFVFDYDSRL